MPLVGSLFFCEELKAGVISVGPVPLAAQLSGLLLLLLLTVVVRVALAQVQLGWLTGASVAKWVAFFLEKLVSPDQTPFGLALLFSLFGGELK